MNVTYTSLEALILKATHESLPWPDDAALEAFCAVMKDSVDGPQLAAQALALRIHSHNAREAILALSMLDRCMRRCNSSFHAEIGKFRFLNELIKLVSPKYFADRTASEVQTRVLQLLHAWSIEYPKETKFKVAYDMLKNQGVVKETPPPLPPEEPTVTKTRTPNAIFEDEEKSKLLQKLLQSKKPEDLQHANRLIKTMVREDERRSEANSRRAQEVSSVLDRAGLLKDMLLHASDASSDELQLIHELHGACARLRPTLHQLAASDLQAEHLDDILHANDVLDEVFEKYKDFVARTERPLVVEKPNPSNNSLLDFAGSGESVLNKQPEIPKKTNVIDELGDIFSAGDGSSQIAEPIKPMNVNREDADLLGESTKTEGWNNLDSLGEQLLKESLPVNAKRMESFAGKPLKKVPMNSLEKVSPKQELPTKNGTMLDLDFFTAQLEKKEKISPVENLSKTMNNDDMMVDITVTPSTSMGPILVNEPVKPVDPLDSILELGLPLETISVKENNKSPSKEQNSKQNTVKPLADINVTLQSVQPSEVPPLTAFEDGGVTVVLHFCKDKPRDDVFVIVVSTTSKNQKLIEDYKFQAVVPKGCKVRLLQPSATSLPPYNPFLPPPAVTQIMLVGRPDNQPTSLKFVLTYTCDEESYSEMGEIEQLPLDNI